MEGLDLLTKGLLFEDVKQFNKKINLDELPELNINFTVIYYYINNQKNNLIK